MLASTVGSGQVIRFTSNTTAVQGYQECGLSGKTGGTATGLATTTTYYFKVNCDGTGVVEKSITTAADVTYTAVIALMNAQMTGLLSGVGTGIFGVGSFRKPAQPTRPAARTRPTNTHT
jgi:hypothetical protein